MSFIEGTVVNALSSDSMASSTQTLISVAHLLRDYHDASQGFLENLSADDFACWQLPAHEPQELICHGDFAPYNVVLKGEQAIGIIDFDIPFTNEFSYIMKEILKD